ncbi:hypothetical protein [Paludisphaera mucosa]|uniref:Uncharacterized protein n=1 Tax=Paludisphaera mucosa TaxID=3030827 RepID=A0ABT6FKU6_9BACT|nr:hypothetical protein [Paludisphaera mucosa]MDG3008162.1 hypothetical protein [Paludisphaera mucosa]
MGMGHGKKGGGRRARPAIERLEGRDLPTAPSLLGGPVAAIDLGSLLSSSASPTTALDARTPTPRELARQKFVAKFSGPFTTGPGRFTDQAAQFYLKGGGGSSAFVHGDLQMALYTPVDPAGATTGIAALIVKNVGNSGNLLVLDLQGDTSSLDAAGRPRRFTWTVNGSSGGTFSGAVGEGTVDIRYQPGGSSRARAGQAGVSFQGRIETNGVTDVLRS